MPLSRLEVQNEERLEVETALLRQGYVPVTAYDAPYPRFAALLPPCGVEQVVTDVDHGRLIWSHPGRSGLDPRAVAPLAIVRVADGLGPDPLDPPVDLASAARELLEGDIDDWLQRPQHRGLVPGSASACLLEADENGRECQTHPVTEPGLQRAADALGDMTYARCRGRTWRSDCTQWGLPTDKPHDLAGLVRCALQATLRLGGWSRRGVSGFAAWDLTRYGVTAAQLQDWHAAGFTTDEVTLWWAIGKPGSCARRRDAGESPYRPIQLPPVVAGDGKRGITGFIAWKMSCHTPDRYHALVRCSLCRAKDTESPCRTCRGERRTVPLELEWAEHAQLATLGQAYDPGCGGDPVDCGDENCRTPVATSATGAEGWQK